MTAIANLLLRDARPDNKIHLLLWDTPTEVELQHIAFYNNAHRVNYRENLLQRTNSSDRFLLLHHDLDKELAAIRAMCSGTNKQMVLLEGLDCLIAYLQAKDDGHITLFWKNLAEIRKLERILWILLPHKLAHPIWEKERIRRIPAS